MPEHDKHLLAALHARGLSAQECCTAGCTQATIVPKLLLPSAESFLKSLVSLTCSPQELLHLQFTPGGVVGAPDMHDI